MSRSSNKGMDTAVRAVAIVGSLVLLNVVALSVFGRLDLTHDKQFTLSKATESTLRRLDDPVTVRAYFTKDLPPPFSSNTRYVKDLLDEYYAAAGGNFRYEFIDPVSEETEEDKEKKKEVKRDIFGRAVREATSIERELQQLGIPPRQVQVNEDDKLEVKRAYMGIAIKYREETEVIPVVTDTSGLEYEMTTLIRKLSRTEVPKIAIVTSKSEEALQERYGRMQALLGEMYEVSKLDLDSDKTIPDEVDALIVLTPEEPFTDEQKKILDAFVMSGRSVAFLLDAVEPDLSTLQAKEVEHGLSDMLAMYGVKIQDGLLVDPQCATINVQQQMGAMRVAQPVRYPLMPVARELDPDHPVTRGIAQVAFPFSSPIEVSVNGESGVDAKVLVSSSSESFVHSPPYNLDPFHRWTRDQVSDQGSRPILVTLEGALPSWAQKPQNQSAAPEDVGAVATDARVLVASGSTFVTDQFLSRTNEALLLNLVDWLLLDDDMLAIRARGLSAAPLGVRNEDGEVEELGEGTRRTAKYVNVAGVPAAFILFGLIRWRTRENRRTKVSI